MPEEASDSGTSSVSVSSMCCLFFICVFLSFVESFQGFGKIVKRFAIEADIAVEHGHVTGGANVRQHNHSAPSSNELHRSRLWTKQDDFRAFRDIGAANSDFICHFRSVPIYPANPQFLVD